MKPTYLVGDATRPQGSGMKYVCHVVNNAGAWGAGFVVAVSRRWPEPERKYRADFASGNGWLGMYRLVRVEDDVRVFNMVAQRGFPTRDRPMALDLAALATCLHGAEVFAKVDAASLHLPRIGCGIAGGRWTDVEPLLTALSVPVFVYDLPGQPFRERE